MRPSLFADVNVWLALTHSRHAHHSTTFTWFESEQDGSFFFCRFTQLGLLRLLTNQQVMGADVMPQRRAWQAYLHWFEDDRVEFLREPEGSTFDAAFQRASLRVQPSTKLWADAYLAAFAQSAGLTLVTFDQAFPRFAAVDTKILSPA